MQPPSQADTNQVGKYHIVDRLAVGGMAEVFLACERGSDGLDERGLERLVVIKRILPHLAQDEQFVEMFLREARVAARIHHQNVVQIYELGASGGYPFIAMEYVPGSTLKELVKGTRVAEARLTIGAALHLTMQACAGAHAAHELTDSAGRPYGLVHRDISPHNLMVTDEAHLKLLDFGIAKASEGMDNTRTGMLKGKISYMSPEQARQDQLDRRSDVFSLGIVAWELLTGSKPFQASSELATMQAIVTGDRRSLTEVRPDVPGDVAHVIERALQLEATDRWATGDAMRRALRDASVAGDVDLDPDRTSLLVRTVLGERHDRRRRSVEEAMERTLVSLTAAPPATQAAIDAAGPSHTLESGSFNRTEDDRARAAVAGAGIGAVLGGIGAAGLLAAMASVVALAVWVAQPSDTPIDPLATMPPLTGTPVVLSIAPVSDAGGLTRDLEPIRLYLQRTLRRPFTFRVADTYQSAADELVRGDAALAFLPYNTTRQTFTANPDIRVLAVKEVDGSDSTDGYLVVRRDSTARSIDDLVGQTICFTDVLSNTGYRLPRGFIEASGHDPDTDFEATMSGNHEQVLRDLLDHKCDVAGTHSASYTTADQRGVPVSQLRILAITGRTPHDAIVGRGDDPELEAGVAEALLALDPKADVGTDQIGAGERITGFSPAPADYASP